MNHKDFRSLVKSGVRARALESISSLWASSSMWLLKGARGHTRKPNVADVADALEWMRVRNAGIIASENWHGLRFFYARSGS